MLEIIDRLRDIARRCGDGQPLNEDQALWLGTCLEKFLSHQTTSIYKALGLRFPRGGVPWWLEEAIRKRDAALRELAARHFAEHSTTGCAHRLYRLSRRYAAAGWRSDRECTEIPARYVGTPHEQLWHAFKSGAAMPIGERQLRIILGPRERRHPAPRPSVRVCRITH